MLKIITKYLFYFLGCLMVSVLTSCEGSEENKKWQIFNNAIEDELAEGDGVSQEDITDTFFLNINLMKEVVSLCIEEPTINRIGMVQGSDAFYAEVSSTNELNRIQSVEKIRQSLMIINASSVTCNRRGDYDNNPLAVISFVLSSRGLSVSGSIKSLVFRTTWSFENSPNSEENLKDRGYTALEERGWYIYESVN